MDTTVGRRAFLAASGALGLLALLPEPSSSAPVTGLFLTAHEMDTLRAVTAALVPGPPSDHDPGALEARCAEAIDRLLAAFSFHPPLIHAGGPFSGRAAAGPNQFARFIPLDPLAELGWRIRIEGSLGRPEREFAGPVEGLQQTYRSGLALVDGRAKALGGKDFASLLAVEQLVILADPLDSAVQAFVGTALANTLEAMYGPPEYGGNHCLVGWLPIGWSGDAQPRGYTAVQVSARDTGSGVTHAHATRAMRAITRFLPA